MFRITLAAIFLAIVSSCCTQHSCITPPPMTTDEQNSIAVGLAAQLASVPVGGSLSTTFSTIVKNEYDRLTDNDKTLFLFLQAIDCYLKDGKVGQDIAKSMAKMVNDKWSSKETVAAPPTARIDLPALRKKIDTRTPAYATQIHSLLQKFGQE